MIISAKKLLVEKSTGEPVSVKFEKMSKSRYNGVDPQVSRNIDDTVFIRIWEGSRI